MNKFERLSDISNRLLKSLSRSADKERREHYTRHPEDEGTMLFTRAAMAAFMECAMITAQIAALPSNWVCTYVLKVLQHYNHIPQPRTGDHLGIALWRANKEQGEIVASTRPGDDGIQDDGDSGDWN